MGYTVYGIRYTWSSCHQKIYVSICNFIYQQQDHLSLTDNGVLLKSVGLKLHVPSYMARIEQTNWLGHNEIGTNWLPLAPYILREANKVSHLGGLSFLDNRRQACDFPIHQ